MFGGYQLHISLQGAANEQLHANTWFMAVQSGIFLFSQDSENDLLPNNQGPTFWNDGNLAHL